MLRKENTIILMLRKTLCAWSQIVQNCSPQLQLQFLWYLQRQHNCNGGWIYYVFFFLQYHGLQCNCNHNLKPLKVAKHISILISLKYFHPSRNRSSNDLQYLHNFSHSRPTSKQAKPHPHDIRSSILDQHTPKRYHVQAKLSHDHSMYYRLKCTFPP